MWCIEINVISFHLQLRLDFETFAITGPFTETTNTIKILNGAPNAGGKEATLSSNCLTDFFAVTNAGSNSPLICGTNTGSHSKNLTILGPTCMHLTFWKFFSVRGCKRKLQRTRIPTRHFHNSYREIMED